MSAQETTPSAKAEHTQAPSRKKRKLVTAAGDVSAPAVSVDLSMYSLPDLPGPPPSQDARAKAMLASSTTATTQVVEGHSDLPRLVKIAGKPPIWCNTRQELCESLPYFRSYQGGHYDSNGLCLGYLLDKFPSARDVCAHNGRVIISHGGGCSEIKNGQYCLRADQDRSNTRISALVNCCDSKTPVALLVGEGYRNMSSYMLKTGVKYAVLGLYMVTDHWAEAEMDDNAPDKFFIRYKFRFEWVADQGEPWFADVIEDSTPSRVAAPEPQSGVSAQEQQLLVSVKRRMREMSDHSASLALADEACRQVVVAQESGPRHAARLSDEEIMVAALSLLQRTTALLSAVCSDAPPSPARLQPASLSPVAATRPPLDHRILLAQPPSSSSTGSARVEETVCDKCKLPSPQRFSVRIKCCRPECSDFFQLCDGTESGEHLTFSDAFLLPRSPRLNDTQKGPTLLPRAIKDCATTVYSLTDWRGAHCRKCGRLSSRVQWDLVQCSNDQCDESVQCFLPLVTPDHLHLSRPRKLPADALCFRHQSWFGYTLVLDGPTGAKVHHLWTLESNDADEILREYQSADTARLFKRNSLRNARFDNKGALCAQFTFNAGEQYNHAIKAPTIALEEAPTGVKDARDLLEDVTRAVSPTTYDNNQFNEVLSVAYMDGCKMNFHDDGERGLGPLVASLSLGSDAKMSFRRKKVKGQEAVKADALIHLELRHGDITIMDGYACQKLFEHKVVPNGLRFAATARHIGSEHLNPKSVKKTPARPAVSRAPSSTPPSLNLKT